MMKTEDILKMLTEVEEELFSRGFPGLASDVWMLRDEVARALNVQDKMEELP